MKSIATAVAAAMLIAGGYAANSQMGSHMAHHPKMAKGNSTAAMCKQMMGERHQAMMHMNEMDTKLNSMVQTTDLVTGDDKIAAMSDLLKTLVSQRTQMRSMMESMDSKMMGHMMMHMKPQNHRVQRDAIDQTAR